MRVILTLVILALALPQGACSRKKRVVYAQAPSEASAAEALPDAAEPTTTKPRTQNVRPSPARAARTPRPASPTRATSTPRAASPTRAASPAPKSTAPKSAEQQAQARLAAARAKAERLGGVHMLSESDIDGLTYAQIRELRGY